MLEANCHSPSSITIITTYQCTAACKDCCFESNPNIRGKLSACEMLAFIEESICAFKELKLVVFSGGEPLLLGNDLLAAISFAKNKGLSTRVVSNGYWGKSSSLAEKTAIRLRDAGLTEINISTGPDHSEYVPLSSIITAIRALAFAGIPNRVSLESDHDGEDHSSAVINHPTVVEILCHNPDILSFQINSWMPFHRNSIIRKQPGHSALRSPCPQLFENIVLTPHRKISACCGLTFEHINQLKLGPYGGGDLRDLYNSQFEDFLKIWIRVDGPLKILEKFADESRLHDLYKFHHICQLCAHLHHDKELIDRLKNGYLDFVEEVIPRFLAVKSLATLN